MTQRISPILLLATAVAASACAPASRRAVDDPTRVVVAGAQAEAPHEVDLAAALHSGRMRLVNRDAQLFVEGGVQSIRVDERDANGAAWIDTTFTSGTLEVEVRGRTLRQRSFPGLAFAGANDSTYEAVYLRPFNFHASDSAQSSHMVQYVAHPEFTWRLLREQHPGIYENGIAPPPPAEEWVRLRLIVDDTLVRAYVNGAPSPSLTVRRLRPGASGRVGLWVGNPSPGDFRRVRFGAR